MEVEAGPRLRVLTVAAVVALSAACAQQSPTLDQRTSDFVTASYIHGVPYDEARALGPQAVPILLSMLDDPARAAFRSNIVVTLGILGSDQAEQRLRAFVESGSGTFTADELSVHLDALTALGYAANVATTDVTLNYLVDGLKNDVWPTRVGWRLPTAADPSARLRERCIAALGLSGKAAALPVLQALLGGASSSPSEQALVTEAIKANQYIAANGLSRYYQTFLRH